jgi:RNA polymerase sigma-70 factor (ECF subfamily)
MGEAPRTRATLVVRLRDHRDSAAWAEFVELYGPLVRGLARRAGLQAADAADLEQEVFRAVAAAIETYDPDPSLGSFRGWLHRIARNLMINWLAARKRQPVGTGDSGMALRLAERPDPAASPDDTAVYDEAFRRRLFRWAADRVRPRVQDSTWRAFWGTAVEGKPAGDVAAELGLSVGAVYVHRNRVMARIRHEIAVVGDQAAGIVGDAGDSSAHGEMRP